MLRIWIALLAADLGLPVSSFLAFLGRTFSIRCIYCEFGQRILRNINKHGRAVAASMLKDLLEAKQNNDTEKLEELKKAWL